MTRPAAPLVDFQPRSHAEILQSFNGLDLVHPELVLVPRWRPDDPGDAPGRSLPMGGQVASHEP